MNLKQIVDRIEVLKELIAERGISGEDELRFNQKMRLEWNYHSVHMEGNKLTKGETEVLMLDKVPTGRKHMDEYKEMQNHFDAVKYVEKVAPEKRPLTKQFIEELHTVLLKEPFRVEAFTADGKPTTKLIKVGEYKDQPNYVETDTGEYHFYATVQETPAMMTELVDWCRNAEQTYGQAAAFARAAVLHYRFVSIHPFDDGNGRMARLLMNYLLLQADLPPVIISSDKKDEYLAVLRQTDIDNLDPFIEYIGQQLISSLELKFKAAKGESLEEPGDFEKHLALLDNRIENLDNDEIKQEKSEVLIHNIISEVLIPFAKSVDRKIGQLKKHYQNYEFSWSYDGRGKYYEDIQGLDITQVLHESYVVNPQDIRIQFSLKGFKKAGTKPFQVSGELFTRFSQYSYQIFHANKAEDYLEALYHQLPNEEKIEEIAKSMVIYFAVETNDKIDKLSKQ